MPYIKDYLQWRGDLDFDKSPINDVDALILSMIPLLDLDGLPSINKKTSLHDLMNEYLDPVNNKPIHLGLIIGDDIAKTIISLKDFPRFQNLIISDYFNEIDKEKAMQCCGCIVKINDDLRMVCCSGTDDTVIGWKENLIMIHEPITNGEVRMKEFIEFAIKKYGGKFIVAGHSKGGILAEIGAATLSDKDYLHIEKVLAYDSPGLPNQSYFSEKILDRIRNMTLYIPDSSIVGRTFEHIEKPIILKSTNNGLYQHDPFSWKVLGTNFVTVSKCTKISDDVKELVDDAVNKMTNEEKYKFVDLVMSLFDNNNVTRLLEVEGNKKAIAKTYSKFSKQDKKFLSNIFFQMEHSSSFRKTIYYLIIDSNKEKKKSKTNAKNPDE